MISHLFDISLLRMLKNIQLQLYDEYFFDSLQVVVEAIFLSAR
jgi:hypothetical protein